MNYKDFARRLAIANKYTNAVNNNRNKAANNPAIIATYVARDPITGLIQTATADGGVGYQRQIYTADLSLGDVIPVTLQIGTAIGFADGLSENA